MRGATEQGVIGGSIRRKEDHRYLTGAGQYTDDISPPNHVHAYLLRSPHAHATYVDMPASPHRVWSAIQSAKKS
jgi:carbon-monoxide dehydrogenase large subunit